MVAADPGAELENAPYARDAFGEPAGDLVFEAAIDVECRGDQGPLKEEQGTTNLVLCLWPFDAQLVSLPQNSDLLGEPVLRLPALRRAEALDRHRFEDLAYPRVPAANATPLSLGRVGRQNEAHAQPL